MNINDKEIYLIRHGETMWNVNGLPQGSRNDIPLNMIGKEQSLITGDYLNNYEQKYSNFDLVICSPMIRAKETAEIICKKIGYDHNKIIYFEELKEIDKGLISIGKTNNELKKDTFYNNYFSLIDFINKIKDPIKYNMCYEYVINNLPKKYEHETIKDVKKRCSKVINNIIKTDKKKILIISHGGTIVNGILSMIFNFSNIHQNFLNGSNCHISYLTFNNNKFELIYGPSTKHFSLYNKKYFTK
jgi:broad specificity phosphatase PhoE